jgi:hypothetical protein
VKIIVTRFYNSLRSHVDEFSVKRKLILAVGKTLVCASGPISV